MTNNPTTITELTGEITNLNQQFNEEYQEPLRDIAIQNLAILNLMTGLTSLDNDIPNPTLDEVLNDWADGVKQLNRIDQNKNLYTWLLNWYGAQEYGVKFAEKQLHHFARAGIITGHAFYYVTGIGYDTIDQDLLGGNGDGRAHHAMLNWLNHQPDAHIKTIRNQWLHARKSNN